MQKYKQKFSNMLDIPKDVLMDLPKITMIGDIQVYIENHKGIIEYTSNLVRISTGLGQLVIVGEGLILRNIGLEEIYLDGQIGEIKIDR